MTESQSDMLLSVELIKKLEREIAVRKLQLEFLKDSLKESMKAQGVSRLNIGKYQVRYTEYTTHRFDVKAFKADYADLYKSYTIARTAHMLTIK